MTYTETLDYLYSRLPMFTRIGAAAMKKDLHNTIALCNALDNPQEKFSTIHIAGTNGKGSTSHMLAAVLQQAGYKTGLYTSPHLKDFRERIRINGEMITEEFVTGFTAAQQGLIEEISPSFFEVTVAMAFSYFASCNVDVAIIEVGLGGRLDSTNIITPELSVITNISYDHMNLLGNTLQEIAGEKAGIIKAGIPVVIGEHSAATDAIFTARAREMSSPLIFADRELAATAVRREGTALVFDVLKKGVCRYANLKLDLSGSYQLKNVLTVLSAIDVLQKKNFPVAETAIRSALENTAALTGLQGRWQQLGEHPLIICDTGHNIAGIQEVLQNISATPHQKLHMVIGMLNDKDVSGVLYLLPDHAAYYFCQPQLERAMPAEMLADKAAAYQLRGEVYSTVSAAVEAAKAAAGKDDMIFIGGSTFVVAEAL